MSTPHRIRRAVADDLDALLGLNAEYCEADQHEFHEPTARAGFAPLLQPDTDLGAVWVVEATASIGEPVVEGYAVVTWGWSIEIGGREALLDEIYLRSRGVGIGGELVAAIVEMCGRADARRIILETEQTNEGARRFYLRHGFVVDDSIWLSLPLTPTLTPTPAPELSA